MGAAITPQLILHIGSDKAGSSAIQNRLLLNREGLLNQGVYVPELLVHLGAGHQALFEELFDNDNPEQLTDALAKGSAYPRTLISWEGLHFLQEGNLLRLKEIVDGFSLRVIFYVREQADLLQTGLIQEVRSSGRRVDFESESRFENLPETRNFAATIERWERTMGPLAWEVSLFDKRVLPAGDVVRDFAQRLGCELPVAEQNTITNPSLDLPSVRLIGFLEDTMLPDGQAVHKSNHRKLIDIISMDQVHNPYPGEKYFLDTEAVDRIRAHYRAGNQCLIDRYGVSRALLEYRDLPRDASTAEEQLRFAIDRSLSSLLRLIKVPLLRVFAKNLRAMNRMLSEGWYPIEDWGVWARGHRSVITGRLDFTWYQEPWQVLEIAIKGRYFRWPRQSRVIINGEERGVFNLKNQVFELDKSTLEPPCIVKIELFHERLFSVSKYSLKKNLKDDRELSFGLESLQFNFK